jgi:hypothetical protein
MLPASTYKNTRGAAEHLDCSASYLEKLRVVGGGPRFVKIGKSVRYKLEHLDDWASGRTFGSTSEYGAASVG